MKEKDLVARAVKGMVPLVANEAQAWNLWNSLNASPEFIEAFQHSHGKLPDNAEEIIEDAVWEELEEALEGPLKLDLNELDESEEFQALVKRVSKLVFSKLNGA
jgi:hypothetical protein